jgi:hypothetical protein
MTVSWHLAALVYEHIVVLVLEMEQAVFLILLNYH